MLFIFHNSYWTFQAIVKSVHAKEAYGDTIVSFRGFSVATDNFSNKV